MFRALRNIAANRRGRNGGSLSGSRQKTRPKGSDKNSQRSIQSARIESQPLCPRSKSRVRLKRAIELAPNNSDAHRAYAHLLSNTGRHDEAVAEIKRARELDPLSLITNALEGQFLFYAGRDAEAFDRFKKTLEIEPNFWIAHNGLARIYIRQKRFAEAVAALNKAIELSGGSTEPMTQLGYALAKSGNREKAQATLEELKSLAAESYVPAYSFAMIYNGLGEKEEALNYLEKSFQEREVQMSFIKIDTRWDNLSLEPRFAEIIKQMNFN
jgi:Flp pilus assembly protein TadD